MAESTYQAGVKEYRKTYWTPDYMPLDTDLLAVFKIVAQAGVPREEAAAAVAAESSTGTWTTVWTDLLTDLDYYKGRAYRIEAVPGRRQLLLRLHRLSAGPVRGRLGRQRAHLAGGQRVRLQGGAQPAPGGYPLPARLCQDLRRAAERHPAGARPAEQIRPPAAGLHDQAEAGPVGQELRPRGLRVPARRPGFHQGRREHQQPAVHALAAPLRVRHGGRAEGRGRDRRAQGPLPQLTAPTPEEMYKRAEFAK